MGRQTLWIIMQSSIYVLHRDLDVKVGEKHVFDWQGLLPLVFAIANTGLYEMGIMAVCLRAGCQGLAAIPTNTVNKNKHSPDITYWTLLRQTVVLTMMGVAIVAGLSSSLIEVVRHGS